jgi:hypothetical protein
VDELADELEDGLREGLGFGDVGVNLGIEVAGWGHRSLLESIFEDSVKSPREVWHEEIKAAMGRAGLP